jgi:hypothetical protein
MSEATFHHVIRWNVENQQHSYEVFEKKPDRECPTRV